MGIILDHLLLMGPGTIYSNSYWREVEKRQRKMFEPDTVTESYDEEDTNDSDRTVKDVVLNTGDGGAICKLWSDFGKATRELNESLGISKGSKQLSATPEKIVGMEMSATNEEESVLDEMEEEAIRQAIEKKSSW